MPTKHVELKTISIGNSMICSDIWPRGGGTAIYGLYRYVPL